MEVKNQRQRIGADSLVQVPGWNCRVFAGPNVIGFDEGNQRDKNHPKPCRKQMKLIEIDRCWGDEYGWMGTKALNDRAKEGFIKIKAEPDERLGVRESLRHCNPWNTPEASITILLWTGESSKWWVILGSECQSCQMRCNMGFLCTFFENWYSATKYLSFIWPQATDKKDKLTLARMMMMLCKQILAWTSGMKEFQAKKPDVFNGLLR